MFLRSNRVCQKPVARMILAFALRSLRCWAVGIVTTMPVVNGLVFMVVNDMIANIRKKIVTNKCLFLFFM